ncbi:hypothetical protein D3C72_1364200 [compost metagenome]
MVFIPTTGVSVAAAYTGVNVGATKADIFVAVVCAILIDTSCKVVVPLVILMPRLVILPAAKPAACNSAAVIRYWLCVLDQLL